MFTLYRACFLYYLVTRVVGFVPVRYQLWPGQCASKEEHRFLFSQSCGAGAVGRNCPEATQCPQDTLWPCQGHQCRPGAGVKASSRPSLLLFRRGPAALVKAESCCHSLPTAVLSSQGRTGLLLTLTWGLTRKRQPGALLESAAEPVKALCPG